MPLDRPAPGAGTVSPPWGALPAEQFLIREWDWASADTAEEQRRQLIRRLLQLPALDSALDPLGTHRDTLSSRGCSRETWDIHNLHIPRPPTAQEIEIILEPWRPLRIRDTAVRFWLDNGSPCIWLRTYYHAGTDEAWEAFIQGDREFRPDYEEELDYRFLSDEACFNFGEDWALIFDILPESRGYPQGHRFHPGELDKTHEKIRRALEINDQVAVRHLVDGLHIGCHAMDLYVTDERSFGDGLLRLLFLDESGEIIRHGRLAPEESHMLDCYWLRGMVSEIFWSSESGARYCSLGTKYRPSGEIGKVVYDLGDETLQKEFKRQFEEWETEMEEIKDNSSYTRWFQYP